MQDHSTPPRRAAIYPRISSDKQEEGASLDEQERICREYAAEHGYEVVAVYREIDDGEEPERRELRRLLDSAQRGEIDTVIVWKQDRLGRGTAIHVVLYFCNKVGLEPLCVLEPFAEGIIDTSIRAIVSGEEKKNIKIRTQSGRKARAMSGRLIPGNRPLYGYQWRDEQTDDGKKGRVKVGFAPHPDTALVVQRIYAELAGGKSLRKVAEGLNADRVLTPRDAARWLYSTLRQIVTNPAYCGEASAYQGGTKRRKVRDEYGKTHYLRIARPESERLPLPEGTIPALVSREQWAQVQERLTRNKQEARRNSSHPEAFLLRAGFIKCGHCGKAVATTWKAARPGTGHSDRANYVILRRPGEGVHADCPSTFISADKLDAEIWAFFESVLDRPEQIFRRLAQLSEEDTTKEELAGIDKLLAGIARKRASIMRVAEKVDDVDEAGRLAERLGELARERREYEARRAIVLARREGWEAKQEQLRDIAAWVGRTRASLGYATLLPIEQDGDMLITGTAFHQGGVSPELAEDFDRLQMERIRAKIARRENPPTYQQKRNWLAAIGLEVTLFPDGHQPRYHIKTDLRNAIESGSSSSITPAPTPSTK